MEDKDIKTCLSCKVNTMIADALTTQAARAPSVMALTQHIEGHHFADDIFKCISLNKSVWISIKISPKFVAEDPINNIPALVQTDNGLAPNKQQAIIWTNDGLCCRCIYESLGLNKLICPNIMVSAPEK